MEALDIPSLSPYALERGKPMPSRNHSLIQSNLSAALKSRYRHQYTLLSEIELSMPEQPNAVPDIAIYPKLKIDFLDDELTMTQMPLTVIEIVFPTQTDSELLKKVSRYFQVGVRSCWLVMPAFQAVYVYSEIGKYQFFNAEMTLKDERSEVEIPLAEVFEA